MNIYSKRISAWLLMFLCSTTMAWSQEYAITKIPEELMNECANAIIRSDSTAFEVHNIGSATIYRKYAITILNEKADHFSDFYIGYDTFKKVKSIDGVYYDQYGKEIDKIKNKDINDVSAVSSGTIYGDTRVKYTGFESAEYPFTVEFEIAFTTENMLFYEEWWPVRGENVSVEKSVFFVKTPEGQDLRYKTYNINTGDVTVLHAQVGNTYKWELKNFAAVEKEPYSPPLKDYLPGIATAPGIFELEGYQGDASSWKTLGVWQSKVNAGKRELPEDVTKSIVELTQQTSTQTEKIKLLYQYLQQNTRYISVQLGIGGWQPFDAKYVSENGYGDCKALSNYMLSMLEKVGIRSHYTLIRAGDNEPDIDPTFAKRCFNHVILCVPNQGDTVWLECTNQKNPFGYIGSFTDDRNVLLVTESGGVMARTPSYDKDENLQLTNAIVRFESNGNAQAKIEAKYKGLRIDQVDFALHFNNNDVKKRLYQKLDIQNFEIQEFDLQHTNEPYPEFVQSLDLQLTSYASVSNKRIFFQPNLMNKQKILANPDKDRQYDLLLKDAFLDIDTIRYEIPSEYHLEFVPGDIQFHTEFGSYSARFIKDQGSIVYVRRLERNKGKYPPEKYASFIEFCNLIAQSDHIKLVFVKST